MVNKMDFGTDLPNYLELGHFGMNYPEKHLFFLSSNKLFKYRVINYISNITKW